MKIAQNRTKYGHFHIYTHRDSQNSIDFSLSDLMKIDGENENQTWSLTKRAQLPISLASFSTQEMRHCLFESTFHR